MKILIAVLPASNSRLPQGGTSADEWENRIFLRRRIGNERGTLLFAYKVLVFKDWPDSWRWKAYYQIWEQILRTWSGQFQRKEKINKRLFPLRRQPFFLSELVSRGLEPWMVIPEGITSKACNIAYNQFIFRGFCREWLPLYVRSCRQFSTLSILMPAFTEAHSIDHVPVLNSQED